MLLLLLFHLQGHRRRVCMLDLGKTFLHFGERKRAKQPTICSKRLFFTAPRWSTSSLKGSGFVGSSFFFSGRTTASKSGNGWALNCGTCKGVQTNTSDFLMSPPLHTLRLLRPHPPPHFLAPRASSPSMPASHAPALRTRRDRPPRGGALAGEA